MTAGSPRTRRLAARLTAALRSARAGIGGRARDVRAADGGMAVIEFALILPTLLIMLLAGIQIVTYIDATRKVALVAHSVSQMISQATPASNTTVATVSALDLHFSYDSSLVLFPYVMKDARSRGIGWWESISVNYASIQFTPKTSSCTSATDLSGCYTANVVWTSSGTAQPPGGANFRPCGTAQQPADDAAAPSRTALPRSVFGPASLIVIDVVFTFNPTFGSGFVKPVRIARSAYVQPRYASLVKYDTTADTGIASKCPGY